MDTFYGFLSLRINGVSLLSGWNLEKLSAGFMQIFGSEIQDFFQTFSKTIIFFCRLNVIKQVINRDCKKCRNTTFFMMHCKRLGEIE